MEVEVATVSERAAGTQASVLNASGYVTARRRATVSSKVTGKVIEVNVEEGMAVRQGQVLARLDDSTLQATLRLYRAQLEAARQQIPESEVRLAQARVQLQRQERLRADGLNTPNDIDNARAEVDSLVARIASAQEQVKVAQSQIALQQTAIDDTVIRAPFSGVALSKDAQAGEMVSPVSAGGGFTRTGISTIVDMASLEIEVDVNESYINRVRDRPAGDGGARCVSRLADSRQRDHAGADGGSPEGHGAGAHWFPETRSADPARHGREGDVPARSGRERCAGGTGRDAGAGGGGQDRERRPPTPSSCSTTPSSGAPSRPAAPTAIDWKWSRA